MSSFDDDDVTKIMDYTPPSLTILQQHRLNNADAVFVNKKKNSDHHDGHPTTTIVVTSNIILITLPLA